jgi:hypothetical protein
MDDPVPSLDEDEHVGERISAEERCSLAAGDDRRDAECARGLEQRGAGLAPPIGHGLGHGRGGIVLPGTVFIFIVDAGRPLHLARARR